MSARYFHSTPYGVPCAVVTYRWRPSGEAATPCGPSGSASMTPTWLVRTTCTPSGPSTTSASWSADSLTTAAR